MSPTYHAAAVVGCRIPKSKIFLKERFRGCEHGLPQPCDSGKEEFCAQCGKLLWVTLHKAIPEYNTDMGTLCTFRVFDIEWEDFITVAAPGEVSETDFDSYTLANRLDIPTSSVAKRMERSLGQFGLWDETTFGIWAVLWVS